MHTPPNEASRCAANTYYTSIVLRRKPLAFFLTIALALNVLAFSVPSALADNSEVSPNSMDLEFSDSEQSGSVADPNDSAPTAEGENENAGDQSEDAGEESISGNNADDSDSGDNGSGAPDIEECDPSPAPSITTGPENGNLLIESAYPPLSTPSSQQRISGSDRYATAAKISQTILPTGNTNISSAFIASGRDFADALSVGPLASYTASPLLLTRPDSLPQSSKSELQRLKPQTVFIAGGNQAVNNAVKKQIEQTIAPWSGKVKRLSGNDRYETSAKIAQQFGSFSHALLVNGRTFPDGLVAGAAASKHSSPVILTPPGQLGSAAAQALSVGKPDNIYFVGGKWSNQVRLAAASKAGISASNANVSTSVPVISGTDRYETAAKVAQSFWGSGYQQAIFATGLDYADALSGITLSKSADWPIVLTRKDCKPTNISSSTGSVTAKYLLGGTSVLSDAAGTKTCVDLKKASNVSFQNGTYRFKMSWSGQQTNYWCGPATGEMILGKLGATKSQAGWNLNQASLAENRYMATNAYGRTAWVYNKFSVGMNNWTGTTNYRQLAKPSGQTFRNKVLESVQSTGQPVAVDMEEWAGGRHVNNHPNASFSHIMAVEGYDTRTGEAIFLDPGAKVLWSASAKEFRYDAVSFGQFLQGFGIYY